MQISRVHIDGFGIFNDFVVSSLEKGLTVFEGHNESGKTTFLSFVRAILFGFESARARRNQYLPLRGGRHGGRLFLRKSSGETYVVQREPGKRGGKITVRLPSGDRGGMDEFRTVLAGASQDLFRNIFAFGLDELQRFETLSSDEVRGRIYSLGAGVGGVSLPEVSRKIEIEMGEIFKERGSAPRINQIFTQMDTIREQIRRLKENPASYDRYRIDMEELSRQIDETELDAEACRRELFWIERRIQGWDEWQSLQDKRKRLDEIPEGIKFPEEGISRLERLHDQRDETAERLTREQQGLETLERERAEINVDELLAGEQEEIDALFQKLESYQSALRELQEIEVKKKMEEDDFRSVLTDLGPGWDEDRLAGCDTSIPTREQIRQFQDQLEKVEEDFRGGERRVEYLQEEVKQAEGEEEKLAEKLAAMNRPGEEGSVSLDDQERALSSLRIELTAFRKNQWDQNHLRDRVKEALEEKNAVDRESISFGKGLPRWPAVVSLLGALAVFVLYRMYPEQGRESWAIISSVALFSFLFIYLLVRWRTIRERDRQLGRIETKKEECGERIQGMEDQLRDLYLKIERDENAVGQVLRTLKREAIPDEREIEEISAQIRSSMREFDLSDSLKRELSAAKSRRLLTFEKLESAKTRLRRDQNRKEELQIEWNAWLEKHGLGKEMGPRGALEFLTSVEQGREKQKIVRELRRRREEMDAYVKDFNARAREVARRCERRPSEGDSEADIISRLRKEMQESVSSQISLREINKNSTRHRQEIELLSQRLRGKKEDIAQLMKAAGAKNEEDFRKRGNIFQERNILIEEIRRLSLSLERLVGKREDEGKWEEAFRATSLQELEEEDKRLEVRQKELSQKVKDLTDNRGKVSQQIHVLEQSRELSGLLLEERSLREELLAETNQWAPRAICQFLLRKTKEQYERERQPSVVREAQEYLARITRGKYPRILAPVGEETIRLEGTDGTQKDIGELSRGTAEQLYLALRFGLIKEFGKHAEPLPVVMDDILVNFDQARTEAAAEAVVELAREIQVLYFTCHPETVETFKRIVPDLHTISLSDGSVQ